MNGKYFFPVFSLPFYFHDNALEKEKGFNFNKELFIYFFGFKLCAFDFLSKNFSSKCRFNGFSPTLSKSFKDLALIFIYMRHF